MLIRFSYVGTQALHLLASHDLNFGQRADLLGTGWQPSCRTLNDPTQQFSGGTVRSVQRYVRISIPDLPYSVTAPQLRDSDFTVRLRNRQSSCLTTCSGLPLPYNAGTGGNCIPGGTVLSTVAPNGITLVGTRPFSSPNCQPFTVRSSPVARRMAFRSLVTSLLKTRSRIRASPTVCQQISVEKSYVHGLLFLASYPFSKALDQGASFEQQLNPLELSTRLVAYRCSVQSIVSCLALYGTCRFRSTTDLRER